MYAKVCGGAMHELNDVWVEFVDGQRRMIKAVEGLFCLGCMFGERLLISSWQEYIGHYCTRHDGCCFSGVDLVAKDLGEANEDGLPLCPFCGDYPHIGKFNFDGEYTIHCNGCGCLFEEDALKMWSRRV